MNRNLPMDTNKNRYGKPVKIPVWGPEVANPNSITFKQRVKTTAAEVGWSLADMTEPSRCQETAGAAEGAGTVATANEWDRSINCIKRNATSRKLEALLHTYFTGQQKRQRQKVMSLWNRYLTGCDSKGPRGWYGSNAVPVGGPGFCRDDCNANAQELPRNTGTQDTGCVLGIGRGGQERYTCGRSIM